MTGSCALRRRATGAVAIASVMVVVAACSSGAASPRSQTATAARSALDRPPGG